MNPAPPAPGVLEWHRMDRANSTVRLSLAAARAHHEGGRGREVRLGIMPKNIRLPLHRTEVGRRNSKALPQLSGPPPGR